MPEPSEGPETMQTPIASEISNINPNLQCVAPIPIPIADDKPGVEDDKEETQTEKVSEETLQAARIFIATQMAEDVSCMRKMPEFPEMMSLLLTAKTWLQMIDFSVYEFERMFSYPQCSSMLDTVMTALLCTECERRQLDELPSMPYEAWMPRLKSKVSRWFSWYDLRPASQDSVLDINPRFWKNVGENNPLETQNLLDIPYKQRVWVVKALCDTMLNSHPVLRDMCSKLSADDLRDMRDLGKDAAGNCLFHLRTLAEDDLRVYRFGPGRNTSSKNRQQTLSETDKASKKRKRTSDPYTKRRRGRPPKEKKDVEAAESTCSSPNSSYIAESGDFELIVDSLQSLKDLITSYEAATEVTLRPPCEVELLSKLMELLADFQEFDVQLEERLQHSQCEIYTRWQEHQERPADYFDPDIVQWEKPSKLSRSSTPTPPSQEDEEDPPTLEPEVSTEQSMQEHINTPTSTAISFTPEVTRSGRKITSRTFPMMEYGELSDDSDTNDVWTAPGKKKVLKPRLPKIQKEANGEVKVPKKRGRKPKAQKLADETNVPLAEEVAKATPETNSVLTNGALVEYKVDTSTVASTLSNAVVGIVIPSNAMAGTVIPSNIMVGTVVPSNVMAGTVVPSNVMAGTVVPSNIMAETVIPSNAMAGTVIFPNTAPQIAIPPNAVAQTLIFPNSPSNSSIGSCETIVAPTNGKPSVDIASILLSSPSIPGRPCPKPIQVANKRNSRLSTANNLNGQRTPNSTHPVTSSTTPLGTPPTLKRASMADHSTPKPKRTPVRRRLTVSPVTTICRGATTITAAPVPPKISSQVTVTMTKKKSEVIVIDSDDDDMPAIRLPSACSLIRVTKPRPKPAPIIPRLPASISVTSLNIPRSGQTVLCDPITISDDEDEAPKPVYRFVLTDKGQNYAQVLPNGERRILSDEEIALIRAKNNGRLL